MTGQLASLHCSIFNRWCYCRATRCSQTSWLTVHLLVCEVATYQQDAVHSFAKYHTVCATRLLFIGSSGVADGDHYLRPAGWQPVLLNRTGWTGECPECLHHPFRIWYIWIYCMQNFQMMQMMGRFSYLICYQQLDEVKQRVWHIRLQVSEQPPFLTVLLCAWGVCVSVW